VQSYYDLTLGHRSRHRELVKEARRERLAQEMPDQLSAPGSLGSGTGSASDHRTVLVRVRSLESAQQS
jgi:hypothetical protein